MSLKDEMILYTKLSGKDGNHTSIGIIGAYLDGYEKGKADQSHWIPCSEELPPVGQEVLLTYTVKGYNKRSVVTGCWDGEEWLSIWDEYREIGRMIIYHAWMPMPKPWKGDQE